MFKHDSKISSVMNEKVYSTIRQIRHKKDHANLRKNPKPNCIQTNFTAV